MIGCYYQFNDISLDRLTGGINSEDPTSVLAALIGKRPDAKL